MPTADGEPINFDRLWNYQKPDETEQRFREILPGAPPGTPYHVELLTQIARTQSLQRKFDEAHAILDETAGLLTPEMRRPRMRYLLERGRTFNSSNQKEKAIPLFTEAWEIGREISEDNLAIDAAHMVAIAGTPEEAMEWNIRALDLAETTGDTVARNWCGSLYNNIGWTYHGSGQFAEALDIFTRALEWREAHGSPGPIRIAKWCVARTLRSLGRIDEALAIQRELLKDVEATGEPDGFIFEELGECLLLLGHADEARPHFARAHEMLSKDAWVASDEPARIERLKTLSGSGRV
ncbi:MAG: hypothetical protein JWQ98_2411 [Chlorobi bacterium]|nr:hypothetical protein [Chlorobiota bacterium]